MGKIWLLTTAHFKKNREQAVTFFILILLAAALINLALIILLNYDRNFDNRARQLNSADVAVIIQNKDAGYIDAYKKELEEDGDTAFLQTEEGLLFKGSCLYGESTLERNVAVFNKDRDVEIGTIAQAGPAAEHLEKPVWLPWLFKAGGGYEPGDTFELTVSPGAGGTETSLRYQVAGFFEETLLATINSTTTGIVMEEKEIRELSTLFNGNLNSTVFSVKLKDSTQNEKYCGRHLPAPPSDAVLSDAVFYDMVKSARTITSSIGSMIILAFSLILGVISLIVMKFRIGNSIEEDMCNIGALEAMGFVGREIAGAILMQFLVISAAGVVFGTGVTYLILPTVSDMFALQTGIIWEQGFDPASALLTVTIILTAVLPVSWSATKKARRLQPIVALRGGILTHSFHQSVLPLDRCPGNLQLLMAAKSFIREARRSALTGFIVAAVSFTVVFAFVLYDNIAVRFGDYLRNTVGEIFSVRLAASDPDAARELLLLLSADPDVRKAFSRNEDSSVMMEEGTQIICYASDHYREYDSKGILYEGRQPQYENEAAIGGLIAKKLGKQIGDMITLVKDGHTARYLITGFIQGSNYMGRDAALTEDGYRLLSPGYEPVMLAVYLNEGADVDNFISKLKDSQGEKVVLATNYEKQMVSSLGSYRDIVSLLVAVVLVVASGVVALTVFLVIKTMLLRRKREFGIQKAIGYTTVQLAMQSALSFLPVILAGSAAGGSCGYFLINPLLSVLFSGIGVMRANYIIQPLPVAGLCLGITAFGVLMSFLISLKIRKISPCCLIRE